VTKTLLCTAMSVPAPGVEPWNHAKLNPAPPLTETDRTNPPPLAVTIGVPTLTAGHPCGCGVSMMTALSAVSPQLFRTRTQ
jgi:hypothetical protein